LDADGLDRQPTDSRNVVYEKLPQAQAMWAFSEISGEDEDAALRPVQTTSNNEI
jgi:hypothetical protein